MMIAKEQALFKSLQQMDATELLCEMVSFLETAQQEGHRIDEVERELVSRVFEFGLRLLKHFVDEAGDGDQGKTMEIEGRRLQRLKTQKMKIYRSVFGNLEIYRWVYAQREGQKIEKVPLDSKLGLPAGEQSYVLEDWLQRLCIQTPYGEAVATLRDLFGIRTSVRTAERMSRKMAPYAESFQESIGAPSAASEQEILVVSSDGKGIPMRRPLKQRLREELGTKEYPWKSRLPYQKTTKRRTRGERKVRKQMSYVGAVYTIEPFARKTEEIVDEVRRKTVQDNRPRPRNKRLFAEMTQIVAGDLSEGPQRLFRKLGLEVARRNPQGTKKLVCLMDGQRSLWCMQEQWLPQATCILDLFHVMERLWKAAYSLHPQGSVEAEGFVAKYLRMLLDGKVGYVIGAFRRLIKRHRLRAIQRKPVEQAINYFDTNRKYMRYDEYLRAGFPIGSGVVEGACRHLVKDRFERSGMRWEIEGAQSLLHLRAAFLNGEWKSFLQHRIQTEQNEQYASAA